jgi:hypothetical protein
MLLDRHKLSYDKYAKENKVEAYDRSPRGRRLTLLETTIKYVMLCAYQASLFHGVSREMASRELSRST